MLLPLWKHLGKDLDTRWIMESIVLSLLARSYPCSMLTTFIESHFHVNKVYYAFCCVQCTEISIEPVMTTDLKLLM